LKNIESFCPKLFCLIFLLFIRWVFLSVGKLFCHKPVWLRLVCVVFLCAIIFLCHTPAYSQTVPDYFYHDRDYGSEAIFNPLLWVINSGYFTFVQKFCRRLK